MEKRKIGVRAKIYFVIGLVFLIQLILNIKFVETSVARQAFVILPGDIKSILVLAILVVMIVIVLVVEIFLKFVNNIFKTSFSSKKLQYFFGRRMKTILIIPLLFLLSGLVYLFLIPKVIDVNLILSSSTFINMFLFSFLTSFLLSDLVTPYVKERLSIERKNFRVWPYISFIIFLVSIGIIGFFI
jgi:hypothetical protein